MNTVRLITDPIARRSQICDVSKRVHHGQMVKEYLDKYGFNLSAVARNCNKSKQAMTDWYNKAVWSEEMLELISKATNHDFSGQVQAQDMGGQVQEQQASYGKKPDMQIIFNIDFDDPEAVKRAAQLIKISKQK